MRGAGGRVGWWMVMPLRPSGMIITHDHDDDCRPEGWAFSGQGPGTECALADVASGKSPSALADPLTSQAAHEAAESEARAIHLAELELEGA